VALPGWHDKSTQNCTRKVQTRLNSPATGSTFGAPVVFNCAGNPAGYCGDECFVSALRDSKETPHASAGRTSFLVISTYSMYISMV